MGNQFQELELIASHFAPNDFFERQGEEQGVRHTIVPDPAEIPVLDEEGEPALNQEGQPIMQAAPLELGPWESLDSFKAAHPGLFQ